MKDKQLRELLGFIKVRTEDGNVKAEITDGSLLHGIIISLQRLESKVFPAPQKPKTSKTKNKKKGRK